MNNKPNVDTGQSGCCRAGSLTVFGAEAPCDLTAGTEWQWRVEPVQSAPGAWCSSLGQALESISMPTRKFDLWPEQWTVFAFHHQRRTLRAAGVDQALAPPPSKVLATVPRRLLIEGTEMPRHLLRPNDAGIIDLARQVGPAFDGRTAFMFAKFQVPRTADIVVYANGDYRMRWWCDGRPLCPMLISCSGSEVALAAHQFTMSLAPGTHVMAVQVISGSGGWAVASEASEVFRSPTPPSFGLAARRCFEVSNPDQFIGLEFVNADQTGIRLNRQCLPRPLADMRYQRIPGLPTSLLVAGENCLRKHWTAAQTERLHTLLPLAVFRSVGSLERPIAHGTLYGLTFAASGLQTGPILNWASVDSATLTCRTRASVSVALEVAGRRLISPPALIHRFQVDELADTRIHPYTLQALPAAPDHSNGCQSVSTLPLARGNLRTLSPDGEIKVAVLGDVYPFDDTWSKVAEAVRKTGPDLVFFTGDMVLDGREDLQWDRDFFNPGRQLLGTVPFYPVIGNHENNCSLFEKIFLFPNGNHRGWSQGHGPALFIGIDGSLDWSPGGAQHSWLEACLRGAGAAFVFLFTHYPPFSSGGHGRLQSNGKAAEGNVRQAREHLLPLLARYRATAVFCGHEHSYERSEPPNGPTVIVSAGAGSRLYGKNKNATRQNPFSRVFHSEHHYCLLEISRGRTQCTAYSLRRKVLDRRVWTARPR